MAELFLVIINFYTHLTLFCLIQSIPFITFKNIELGLLFQLR